VIWRPLPSHVSPARLSLHYLLGSPSPHLYRKSREQRAHSPHPRDARTAASLLRRVLEAHSPACVVGALATSKRCSRAGHILHRRTSESSRPSRPFLSHEIRVVESESLHPSGHIHVDLSESIYPTGLIPSRHLEPSHPAIRSESSHPRPHYPDHPAFPLIVPPS
jgi:hypothetical protein